MNVNSNNSAIVVQKSGINNQQEHEKNKKKSHGNRKEQHQRRRERRRQKKLHDSNTTRNTTDQSRTTMNNGHHHPNKEQEQFQNNFQNIQHKQKLKNKRKRQNISQDNTHVSRSMSQLSISQQNIKKRKKTETNNTPIKKISAINAVANDFIQEDNKELLSGNSIHKFKPKYLRVSIRVFKKMLSRTNENDEKVVQYLDSNEKLHMIRQLAEFINNVHYFELQKHLWQAYYNIGLKENIWTSESTSNVPTNQSKTYFLPKHLIDQRQKTIVHQLQRASNELHEFTIKLEKDVQQWQPVLNFNFVMQIVTECVIKHQQRLKQAFQNKIAIAELNLNDRQSITKFYALQPNQEQICLTKNFWRTVADVQKVTEQIEVLRQRISLHRIPSKINKTIDHSMNHIQPMLDNPVIDKDQRAGLISKYSKTITQYKFDLMSLNLNTLENIRRAHQQKRIDLHEKIKQSCHHLLQEAITNRQQTMENRHKKLLQYRLKTFFDEAPTTVSNE